MEFSQIEKTVAQFFIEREGDEIIKVIKKLILLTKELLILLTS